LLGRRPDEKEENRGESQPPDLILYGSPKKFAEAKGKPSPKKKKKSAATTKREDQPAEQAAGGNWGKKKDNQDE